MLLVMAYKKGKLIAFRGVTEKLTIPIRRIKYTHISLTTF
jgi:hypothetical protein